MHNQPGLFRKAALCGIVLTLALTACGKTASVSAPSASDPASSAAVTPAGPPSVSPGAEEQASAPASSDSESGKSGASGPGDGSQAGTETPSPDGDGQPKYQLNKAYRIVPIDESASPKQVVLLTFDDGPKNAETLGKILDTLDKHDAKAIFFVNGYRVKANPELLKEIDARGHAIGNHSYDHINLRQQSDDIIREQIENVQEQIRELTGKTPKFFRPPFGAANDTVKAVAKENGMLFMTWSNGSLDWDLGKNVRDKPQAVIDHVMEQLHPGSNILMHELEWTADALDRLLTQLEEKGYGFVAPDEIAIELE